MEAESLLRNLILPLIEHPDDLHIECVEQEDATLLRVRLNNEDMGRVIGRQGRRAEALRTILKAKGNVLGERIFIDISDEEMSEFNDSEAEEGGNLLFSDEYEEE